MANTKAKKKMVSKGRQGSSKIKILLAEDSEDQARLLIFYLKKAGYDVTHVADGMEAYKTLLGSTKPDLLITDILMPGMSGFDLLSKLKTEKRTVSTIVLTGKQSEEDALRGFQYGALDYIRKPFSPSEVMARVETVLRRNQRL